MCRPTRIFWTLVFFMGFLAMPWPPASRSHAEADVEPLQASADSPNLSAEAPVVIDEKALEARVLGRLRREMHADVDTIATRSITRAMRRLRDGGDVVGEEVIGRPLGKALRLTFELQPELVGAAPVSVVTRRNLYSAFSDTLDQGASLRLNIGGEVALTGYQQSRVMVDFSALLQFDEGGHGGSGSSGAEGSADVAIGEPAVLMSVGARDLVLTVDEL